MVSVCLPSDALLQHLPSYLGFSYLGQGDLLTAASPDLERGVAPLGPPAPGQPEGQPRGQKQKDGQENMERAWVPGDTPEPLSLSPVELNHPDFL